MLFERFVAIDWSGARGPSLKGLQVAICEAGTDAPVLVTNPSLGRIHWRRPDLVEWLESLSRDNMRTLLGMDFAFAFPFCDRHEYFPGAEGTPADPIRLWSEVEDVCATATGLYGGPFYLRADARYAAYLRYQTYTGNAFEERFRETELACRRIYGTRPACDFVCVGSNSVGVGSIAGMRLLSRLHQTSSERLQIWPFETDRGSGHVLVEIFPRLFYLQAEQDPNAWADRLILNDVLSHYHSQPLPEGVVIATEDEADAVVSAAALRAYADDSRLWATQEMSDCAAGHEGWIFGV